MKITSSYAVRVMGDKNITAQIANTVSVYREAVMYLIDIVNAEWESVGPVYKAKKNEGQRAVERLIHTTKKNSAKYDFDSRSRTPNQDGKKTLCSSP